MEKWLPITEVPVRTAIVISLLSAWVLVGLFQYLNRYTRRQYFNTWTAGWLFYAMFLVISFWVENAPNPVLVMAKNWALATGAVLMLWGSFQLLKLWVTERLIVVTILFVTAWSYVVSFQLPGEFWAAAPAFFLLALASGFVAWSFFSTVEQRRFLGAGLLTFGFALWAMYLAIYPFLRAPDYFVSAGYIASGVLQLFIATSMIVLALEEVKQEKNQTETRLAETAASAESFRMTAETNQKRFQQLFENATEAIVVISEANLRILEINDAARRLFRFGANPGPATFDHYCALPGGATRGGPLAWLETLASSSECDLIAVDGARARAELRGGRIPYETGHAYQFCFLELTQRARLEQQLRQAERLSALGRMISGIAHELNNPLAAIKGYTDLILASARLEAPARAGLVKVAKESDRAAALVKEFLTFARADSPELEPVDVHELLRKAVQDAQDDLCAAGVAIDLSLGEGRPQARGSARQLSKVFSNLLVNARQAMAECRSRREIRISTSCEGDIVIVKIADSGPGIPSHILTKIFEPFFTSKPVGTGTGLGLSICHSIIHAHHGRIYYETGWTGGACFVIELPLDRAAIDPSRLDSEVAAEEFTTMTRVPEGLRVVVVDDERPLASLLQQIIELLGHSATAFHSASEALDFLRTNPVDVVFSDYRMPGVNGSEFYKMALASDPDLGRRFVFITGDVMDESTHAFFEMTGSLCVLKPFQISGIEKAIRDVCARTEGSRASGAGRTQARLFLTA